MNRKFLIISVIFLSAILSILVYKRNSSNKEIFPEGMLSNIEIPPIYKFNISGLSSGFLNYAEIEQKLSEWDTNDMVELGYYGESSDKNKLIFFRINTSQQTKPKVLITSCIHGNEPLSTGVIMNFISTLLIGYNTTEEITAILDSRDIYFIPVVSPDSYPDSRAVDGVDPNRNFPTKQNPNKKSVKPISEIQKFFLEQKFNAVISGHTYGRVFLSPWGDSVEFCPDHEAYQQILSVMAEHSKYRVIRACEMYDSPIYGTEIDWYYRHGAFSLVCEFGTHQRKPTLQENQEELNRILDAFLFFLKEAPKVKIHSQVH